MSESRILVLDNDAVRAERTVALLEFMDFNPRWVADANDFDITRHRPNDWMAAIIGGLASYVLPGFTLAALTFLFVLAPHTAKEAATKVVDK